MFKVLLASVLLCFASVATAYDFEVNLIGNSYHVNLGDTVWNEDNRIIGIGYKGYEVMTFVNSYGDRTYGAGYSHNLYDYSPAEHVNLKFNIRGAVLYGYESYKLLPVPMLVTSAWYKNLGIEIAGYPTLEKEYPAVFLFSGKLRF